MPDLGEDAGAGGDARPIVPPGVWLEARSPAAATPCPGLVLDRDGVVVADRGYLSDPAGVELLPGAARLIAAANRAAVPVVVVTNQSGIARGRYGWADFARVEREIARALAAAGARLDAVAACPFHPDFTPGYGPRESHWRKPGPGLVTAAAKLLNIDIATSWLIGDQLRDIEAARNAGLAGAILLRHDAAGPAPDGLKSLSAPGFRTFAAASLAESTAMLNEAGLLWER